MAITDNKITTWTSPVADEADQPSRTASAMKAVFDGNSNQLKTALNDLIDDLVGAGGSAEIGSAAIGDVEAGTLLAQLTAIRALIDGRVKSIGVGTVTTGAAGSSASVSVSGTMPDILLNFTIPKGDVGDPLAAHASHHASDGDDVLTPAAIGAQMAIASLDAGTSIADTDYIAGYTPAAGEVPASYFKILWSNIKSVLKTYFDTVYTTALVAITGYSKAAEAAALAATDTINQALGKLEKLLDGKISTPTAVSATGSITVTVADNREYAYTAVTSLTMTGAAVNCHGFVTFTSGTPTISVASFTDSSGDDIATAAASQVWEFSVFNGYIVWKNWSA